MKTFLSAALIGIAALTMSVPEAKAGCFLCHFHSCCGKCGKYCIKPYNAFSTVPGGHIKFGGAAPIPALGFQPNGPGGYGYEGAQFGTATIQDGAVLPPSVYAHPLPSRAPARGQLPFSPMVPMINGTGNGQ